MTVNNYADIFCKKRQDFSSPDMPDLQVKNQLIDNQQLNENINHKNVFSLIYRLTQSQPPNRYIRIIRFLIMSNRILLSQMEQKNSI